MNLRHYSLAIAAILWSLSVCHAQEKHGEADEAASCDILIRSGRVVDGTGAPWYEADIGVVDGKIAAIGRLDTWEGKETIDAAGLIVAPGFIDMMGQTATPMLEDPGTARNLLMQGITTINAGEGSSEAPLDADRASQVGWATMGEYFQMLDLKGLPVNVVQTVGHTQVRKLILGEEDRRPQPEELARMQRLVAEAMEAGAIGASTALIYPPAVYADTEEIAALAATAGKYGGRYYTHMRNEGDRLLEALDEALAIGKEANTPVHVFHLKAAGQQNWGKMQLAIAKIKEARSQGRQVTADIYPYEYNGLGLEALIHPRHFTKGRGQLLRRLDDAGLRAEIKNELLTTDGWENWFRHAGQDWNQVIIGNSNSSCYERWHGKSVAEIAAGAGEDPWDTFFNLVQEDAFALPRTMTDANIIRALQEGFVSFCTDVGPASRSRSVSHPRSHGAFPRLISRYVRDLGAQTLERAIAQATATAANEVMAYDRGRIALGLAADLIVFDMDEMKDNSTPAKPRNMPQGVRHVLVNGVTVLRDGEMTRQRPGYVLRGPGHQESQAAHQQKTGRRDANLAEIDQLMERYLAKHRAAGASLAITDQGRLVYARGFGYADVAQREHVQPTSLFRIASISKPITAVAILQLVDSGKLELDAPVFSIIGGYEPHLQPDTEADERQQSITIRQLLQHRGGWDRDRSFDAMFQSVSFANALGVEPPAGHDEIIRCMLGKPLDFPPGERYAYSNYGYCLLGRVIEKLTDLMYDDYVKQHVLSPLGISAMAIGATRLEGRRQGEVRYYDTGVTHSVFAQDLNQRVPAPYGAWFLESMDSHGGWIASAVDLVRFASAFDNAAECPLLSGDAVPSMFERPDGLAGYTAEGAAKPVYYGLGWQVRCDDSGNPNFHMHGGSLPGTSTKLVRCMNGRNYAVLFNARETAQVSRLAEGIWPELQEAVDRLEADEETDFFPDFR